MEDDIAAFARAQKLLSRNERLDDQPPTSEHVFGIDAKAVRKRTLEVIFECSREQEKELKTTKVA